MKCCQQCSGIEETFDAGAAESDLRAYRRHGVSQTTRWLLDAILAAGVQDATLLDIGGGVGGIQHTLLAAGAARATHVDASSAYLQAAKEEASRQGLAERIERRHGNFVDLAPGIEPADVVTLDRVICCYHDMPGLVEASLGRAKRLYGLVFPRAGWWIRLGVAAGNLWLRLSGDDFRMFAHPPRQVEGLIRAQGFERRFSRRTLVWQAALYERC